MAVKLYFGLPGCGKTTLLTALALDAVKRKNTVMFILMSL